MNKNSGAIYLIKPTLSNKLGVLILTFIVMLIAVGLLKGFVDIIIPDFRSAFIVSSLLQSLLTFILPAWLAAFLCSDNSATYLGVSTRVSVRQFCAVAILMLIMMPVMNYIVEWNENITLPVSFSSLETLMRTWEDAAAEITEMLLADTSVWGLISGILVVGIVTGIAEETFFRAGLQKAMSSSGINHHVAIWTAASIFSILHFQFFGFVPRLLLGALFGYIYCTSSSLWVSAAAHALNNCIVVVTAWLVYRGYLNVEIETFGVTGSGAIYWLSASVLLTLLFISCLWNKSFSPSADNSGNSHRPPKKIVTNGKESC